MIEQHFSEPNRYSVVLPLTVDLSKKKSVHLNLNWYRNAHFFMLNESKVLFKDKVWDQLRTLPFFTQVKLEYVIYPKTRRLFDISNVGSIVDKYFCDAMTEAERWEDDNYNVVKQVTYRLGHVDKKNPRVEVIITELFNLEEDPMRITLEENEINAALSQYLQRNYNFSSGQITRIEYSAGRGNNGITSSIELCSKEAMEEKRTVDVQQEPEQEVVPSEKASNPDFKKIFG